MSIHQIKINVYRSEGVWFFACWIDGDYDCCYELGVFDSASADEAIEAARTMNLGVRGPRDIALLAGQE